MTMSSLFENVFAWAMVAGGVAIFATVRWRPRKLWGQRPAPRGRGRPAARLRDRRTE